MQNRSLKEAIQSGDETEIKNRKAHLEELIADFKNAPGEVPHVIAFAVSPELAAQHGIEKPKSDWYNSPYNNALAASQGRFEDQYWYENAYFIDHPKELTFALDAVKEVRPDIASITAKINKGAYERSVASTSFVAKTAPSALSSIIEETQKLAEKTIVQPTFPETAISSTEPVVGGKVAAQAAHIIQQYSTTSLVEQLFKQREEIQTATATNYLLDQLTRNAEHRKHQVV